MIGRWISGLTDRMFAVLGALILSQAPQVMNQYEHRLGGHIAELQMQIHQMELAAVQSGKTLEQYVQKFQTSPDEDFVSQGRIMGGMVKRLGGLSKAYNNLHHGSIFSRPFVFLYGMKLDIAKETLNSYQIGLAVNLEGLVYALIGICAGFFLYLISSRIIINLYCLVMKNGRKITSAK